jgi:hypothetical protein
VTGFSKWSKAAVLEYPLKTLTPANAGIPDSTALLWIGPKDPLLALWVSQKELLEQNAAQQQKLLSEFRAALGKSQTAWADQAKALAQQSLNAGLQAAQNSTALLLEEAARMNGGSAKRLKKVLDGWSKRWRPAAGSLGWVWRPRL